LEKRFKWRFTNDIAKKRGIADGTMAFHFEKPEGFVFKAGQFGDFTLIDPIETDAEGDIRGFSLASAPYEADLMFATRMRDTAFKRVLKTMEIGTEVSLDAPYGRSRSTITRKSQRSFLQVASELHL
jgi:ferredoxin-NADP reductase